MPSYTINFLGASRKYIDSDEIELTFDITGIPYAEVYLSIDGGEYNKVMELNTTIGDPEIGIFNRNGEVPMGSDFVYYIVAIDQQTHQEVSDRYYSNTHFEVERSEESATTFISNILNEEVIKVEIYRKGSYDINFFNRNPNVNRGFGEGEFGIGPMVGEEDHFKDDFILQGTYIMTDSTEIENTLAQNGLQYVQYGYRFLDSNNNDMYPEWIYSPILMPYQIPDLWAARKCRYQPQVLYWPFAEGIQSYNIYISETNGIQHLVENIPATSGTYSDTTYNNYLEHKTYRISAIIDDHESELTESNTILPDAPAPVESLAVEKVDKTIKITWNNPTTTPVQIYRSTNRCQYELIATLSENTNEYIDTDVELHTRYEYSIYPYIVLDGKKYGTHSYSEPISINDYIELKWGRGLGSEQDEYFVIERKISDMLIMQADKSCALNGVFKPELGINTTLKKIEPWTELSTVTDLEYQDTTFEKGTYYLYSVSSRDAELNISNRVAGAIQT